MQSALVTLWFCPGDLVVFFLTKPREQLSLAGLASCMLCHGPIASKRTSGGREWHKPTSLSYSHSSFWNLSFPSWLTDPVHDGDKLPYSEPISVCIQSSKRQFNVQSCTGQELDLLSTMERASVMVGLFWFIGLWEGFILIHSTMGYGPRQNELEADVRFTARSRDQWKVCA